MRNVFNDSGKSTANKRIEIILITIIAAVFVGLSSGCGSGGNGAGGSGGAGVGPAALASPLIAYSIGKSTAQEVAVSVRLRGYDTRDSDPVEYEILSAPNNGAISGTPPDLVYTPDVGFTGRDQFQYRVYDLSDTSNTANVSILVGGAAVFVVADPLLLNAGDTEVADRMKARGMTVTLVDDDMVLPSDADGQDLVVISSSSGSARVDITFRDVAVPVLTWERFLYDEMQMTGAGVDDNGVVDLQTDIDIIDPSHPLAAGFSGTRTVFTVAGPIVWGSPNENAEIVATVAGDPTKPVLFAYPKGTTMAGGLEAPDRRVGYFLPDNSGATLTPDGLSLLDAAIDSALIQ